MKFIRIFSLFFATLFFMQGCSYFFTEPTIAPINNPEILVKKIWMAQAGSGSSDAWLKLKPAFMDGKIFTSDFRGNVMAMNAESGTALWKTHLKESIITSPGVGDDRIFVATDEAHLFALSQETGEQEWHVNIPNLSYATPITVPGLVIVKTINGQLLALDTKTGEVRWNYHETIPRLILRGSSTPQAEYPYLVTGFADGKLITTIAENGKLVWEKVVALPSGFSELKRMVDIDSDPVIDEGVIYVTSYQGTVSAINLKTAQTIWQHNLSSHAGLAVSTSRVFVSESNGRIWAFDKNTGDILWRQNDLQDHQITAPAVYDNYLVVADSDGYIHWMDQKDGHFVSRQFFTSAGVLVQPEEYQDRLYVYGRNGTIVALQPITNPAENVNDEKDANSSN